MANVSFKKGDSSFINNIPISDGQILFDTEKKTIHLDNGNNRLNVGGTNKEVYIGTEPPTDEDAVIWINPNEIISGGGSGTITDEQIQTAVNNYLETLSSEEVEV